MNIVIFILLVVFVICDIFHTASPAFRSVAEIVGVVLFVLTADYMVKTFDIPDLAQKVMKYIFYAVCIVWFFCRGSEKTDGE